MRDKKRRLEELEGVFNAAANKADYGVDAYNYQEWLQDCVEFQTLCWEVNRELPDANLGYCGVLTQASYVEECIADMEAAYAKEEECDDESSH